MITLDKGACFVCSIEPVSGYLNLALLGRQKRNSTVRTVITALLCTVLCKPCSAAILHGMYKLSCTVYSDNAAALVLLWCPGSRCLLDIYFVA